MKHFEELLNDRNAGFANIDRGQATFEATLDSRISLRELRDALSNLKRGKTPGPDEIIGEYLMIFGKTFENILLKLLNVIFTEHITHQIGP